MARDKFIIISVFFGISIESFMIIGAVFNKLYLVAIALLLIMILLMYCSYLLIVKKSFNLLSGMTEEKAVEIRKNSEMLEKYEKKAKIVGYILIVVIPFLLYFAYDILQ